jgi:hypothetical protein
MGGPNVAHVTRLEKFTVPLSGQEIELQQLDYEGGGMSQLRIRIREGSRFTTVDIDPLTARRWADSLRRWVLRRPEVCVVDQGSVASGDDLDARSCDG